MLRLFVCAAVALMLCVGVGLAQDKGKGKDTNKVSGTVKKVDAATGTLTISVKGKNKGDQPKDMEFKISDTTKVTVYAPTTGDATNLVGKDGLKNEQFKEGAKVMVTTDKDNKVVAVQIGQAKKKDK
jgi:hypothetical protein